MFSNINRPFYISIIIPVSDIFFKEPFPHSGPQIVGKKKQQIIKQAIILIGIRFQIHNGREVQHPLKKVLKK